MAKLPPKAIKTKEILRQQLANYPSGATFINGGVYNSFVFKAQMLDGVFVCQVRRKGYAFPFPFLRGSAGLLIVCRFFPTINIWRFRVILILRLWTWM